MYSHHALLLCPAPRRPDYSPSYFADILTSQEDARRRQTERLVHEVRSWADTIGANGAQSPQRELLAAHLPSVLRLALQCPFDDVREAFERLLKDLKVRSC